MRCRRISGLPILMHQKELLILKALNVNGHPVFVFKGEKIIRADTPSLLGVNFFVGPHVGWTPQQRAIHLLLEARSHHKMQKYPSTVHFDTIHVMHENSHGIGIYSLCWCFNLGPFQSTKPLQSIEGRFDVECISVLYKKMHCPPSEEVSKLVLDRPKPLRSTCQSTAREDYVVLGTLHQEYLKRSFAQRSSTRWNGLQAFLHPESPSLEVLKRSCNKFLENKKRGSYQG